MYSSTIRLFLLSSCLRLLANALSNSDEAHLGKRQSETKPWELEKIQVFTAEAGTSGASYLTFTFQDVNKNIELTTNCERFLLPSDNGSLNDVQNYYPCRNRTVAFKHNKGNFALQRTYQDTA